ncbi:hypothetical protein EG328_010919 [Venturia inaequalis]|uniref:Cytochrome c oxidase assembly protein COX19 n=1 Tax=Venturia inaequalis TaxID=5025 RepID=A0A8H3V5E5_VENIN|nr:hypothetical protein EG328_010919 [Venturia inaequalis]KAE9989824.1 hypothetical protein EG327_002212 [Venturia inaequalis]RDI85605.1 hypothetical protein Vi05172_g4516 [Venturia inaequalis]
MSTFGSPGGQMKIQKPIPPERGSFPLDHEGECKTFMATYLSCLKTHRGTNSNECRTYAKTYLQCRMERNLMAPDEMKNLGFANLNEGAPSSSKPAETNTK